MSPTRSHFHDTPEGEQLRHRIAALANAHGLCRNDAELNRLQEEFAERAWRYANPSNSGRFRIATKGKVPTFFGGSAGALSFDTRADATAYLLANRKDWHGDIFSIVDAAPAAELAKAA